jgi:hypothetical protein
MMGNGVPDWKATLIPEEIEEEILAAQEAAAVEIAYERPPNGVFFTCHPTLHREIFFFDRTIGGTDEHCLVMSPDVLLMHKTRCKRRHCFLYAKEDGSLGVWAVSTLQSVAYCRTGLAAATAALDGWVSIHSDQTHKKYRLHRPTPEKLAELKEPRWPSHFEDVAQAIMHALDDPERFITGPEHPAVAGYGTEIQVQLEG